MKRVVANEQYCIGCRLCEVHCLVAHSKVGRSPGASVARRIIKAYGGPLPRAESRVHVEEQGSVSFAVQCRHCEDAPCLDACISGAMHRSEEGAVQCDEDRCVGCWMCVMVCPYGVIRRRKEGASSGEEETTHRIASKCDLCVGESMPACVANCPNEALTLSEE